MPPVLVSACLAGLATRYDASAAPFEPVLDLLRQGLALPVCPEQLGGLPTPRPPCERHGARILSADGRDFTEHYRRGAAEAARLAGLAGCRKAILKARSPSCGVGLVYDGSFSRRLVPGNGVLAELLTAMGLALLTEDDLR
jgi:uncharacterized protein YbbK (DUF523 family)